MPRAYLYLAFLLGIFKVFYKLSQSVFACLSGFKCFLGLERERGGGGGDPYVIVENRENGLKVINLSSYNLTPQGTNVYMTWFDITRTIVSRVTQKKIIDQVTPYEIPWPSETF